MGGCVDSASWLTPYDTSPVYPAGAHGSGALNQGDEPIPRIPPTAPNPAAAASALPQANGPQPKQSPVRQAQMAHAI